MTDLECDLLAHVVLEPSGHADAIAGGITAQSFTDPRRALAWLVACRVMASGIPLNPVALADEAARHRWLDLYDEAHGKGAGSHLQAGCDPGDDALAYLGGYGSLGDLWSTPGVSRGARSVGLVRDAQATREARAAIQAAGDALGRPDGSKARDVTLAALVERLCALQGHTADRTLGDCLDGAMAQGVEYATIREAGHGATASWGIPALDRMVPLRPGSVYVLAAGPGEGKTSLALQAAVESAAKGGRGAVAIASLEQTGEDLATIIAGRTLGIAPVAIREMTPAITPEIQDQLRALVKDWQGTGSMSVRDAGGADDAVTVGVLVAWLAQRRHASLGRLSLGIIDYLGLIDSPNPKWNDYQTLSHATKAIKRAALGLRIPILLLAQINRAGRGAVRDRGGKIQAQVEPSLADLRGSGTIEQDADAVVFLWRPGAAQEQAATVATQAIISKNRRGSKGRVDLWFHCRHQLFEEAPAEVSQMPPDYAKARGERARSAPSPSEDLFASPDPTDDRTHWSER